ncbi:hypothetical protein JCM8097_002339 [Rhodosporidiobolus ruineniae]
MSTPSPQGQCCVCGTSTATRCAACLSAGFDLFFCSHEHQRLAWPGHKISCGRGGKSASPLRFPPLSPDEVDEAKQAAKLPRMHEATEMTLEGAFELCLPGECGKGVIEELTKPEPFPHLPPAAALAALHFVRITLLEQVYLTLLQSGSLRRSTSRTIDDGPRRSALPPYKQSTLASVFARAAVNAAVLRGSALDLAAAFPIHDPLYVGLHHRLLVQAALESRIAAAYNPDSATRDRRAVGPLFRYRKHAEAQFLRAVEALSGRYPRRVRRVVDARLPSYLEIGKKEAKVLVGANRIGETGYFFEPTLFVEVAKTARITTEETSGPVGIIHKCKNDADILRKCTETEYSSCFLSSLPVHTLICFFPFRRPLP